MSTHPFRLHAVAFATALVLTPALTLAQAASAPAASEPEATTLPAVTVKAKAAPETARSPVSGYAARRSTTATKTDTPLNEVPQSISVVTADQVRDQGSHDLQDVLRYTAGVRVETYGVDNRGDWFALRGGSVGSTLIDGLRRPATGSWGLIRNDPYAFERIEVLRGPASVIAGQNGPGGVVNLVSKRPQAEAAGEVAVQMGNHGHQQLQADLTGPANQEGTLQYRLVALTKDSDTQVTHAYAERQLLAPSLTWRPDGATSLTVYAEYQRDESGNQNAFFPAVGTLLPAPNGPIPMDTFIGEPDWDTYGGKRVRLGWQFEQKMNDTWTLRQNLRADRTRGKMRTMYANWWEGFFNANGIADSNGTYLKRSFSAVDDKDRVTNADALLEGKFTAGGAAHTLLAGVDALDSRASQTYYGDFAASPLDVYNPVYGSFPLPELAAVPATVTKSRRLGVLLQDQLKIGDRWVIVGGVRHDRARTRVEGRPGQDQEDSATSKNLGAVWLAAGGWSPYVNYSESFEPVTRSTTTGELFKPQRGKQLEAGVKWQPADSRIVASAAVYELREKNRLAPSPTNPNLSVQRGEVTVKGFEAEVAGQLQSWDWTAQYSYTDAQVTVPESGQQLEAIPKQTASGWLTHRVAAVPGLRAGAGVRHVGKSSDGAGVLQVPSVNLLDALVSFDTGPWRFAFNANNLTDKKYVASCLGRGDCWFGSRRRAVMTVAYRW